MSPAAHRMPPSPWVENEVTSIEQLRKLRAHAFSGSNGSLHSDGRGSGYFSGSGGVPMTFQNSTDSYSSGSSNPGSAHPQSSSLQQQQLQESPHSAASSGQLPFSAAADAEATPRRSMPHSNNHPGEVPVTARKVTHKPNRTHSRNSSGADSVTYVQEQDPDGRGPPRWVLERRRTSEHGLSELIGREVVQGGWI